MKKTIAMTLATTAFLLTTNAARADETACAAGREKAAGQYASCQSKAKVTYLTYSGKAVTGFAQCRIRYAASWQKLKTRNPGTSCDTATRFVDNGDGTVTDRLTGLVWEKKDGADGVPNLSDRHDVDNSYTWTDGDADSTDGDGTVFTDFLADLNSGGGFAGANGWRLPTIQELQTILLPETYPCAASGCVVSEVGPDEGAHYWSASTFADGTPNAWYIQTSTGYITPNLKTYDTFVRAVRSGF